MHTVPDKEAIERNKSREPLGEQCRAELIGWINRWGIVGVLLDTEEHCIAIDSVRLPPDIKPILTHCGSIYVKDDGSAIPAAQPALGAGEHNCPSCGRWHDILNTPTKKPGCEINTQSSMQYVGMKLYSGDATLQEVLEWMVDGGSAVSLNFGEDTGLWECSWITWGERFTGVQKLVRMAVLESLNKAFARAVELGPPKEREL
jgi:hypothetical protein